MIRMSTISLTLALSVVLAVTASAVPDWVTDPIGQPPTTHQVWTFENGDMPAVPEVVENTYGTPTARFEGSPESTLGWYSTFNGRDGVWHAEDLTIIMDIPNRDVADEHKEIWVSVIYQTRFVSGAVTPDPAGDAVIPLAQTITALGDGWNLLEMGWRVEPNPQSETVCLTFSGTGGSIDSIQVDTICAPEPATLLLLGLGGFAVTRRRR